MRPAETAAAAGDSVDSTVERFRSRLPADVLVRHRACPFECCTYRQWVAEGAIPVLASQRGSGPPAFSLRKGEPFLADSGNVWITGVQLVVVDDSVADRPYWAFGPGDTLVVLDPIGEGHFHVWHDGRVKEVEGFWEPWRQRPGSRTIGRLRTEWWVHVTLADGRTGWFEASPDAHFSGADACG